MRPYYLVRAMAKLGHRCLIITSDSNLMRTAPKFTGRRLLEAGEGFEIHWLKTLKFNKANSIRRILSWFHFEWNVWWMSKRNLPRPDAVIVSSLSLLTIFNGLWLRHKYGCRLIFEVRDIWPLTIIEEGFSPRNPFVMGLRWIEKLAYRTADSIVGTMPNLIEHVAVSVRNHPPVYCVPMGVDENTTLNKVVVSQEWLAKHSPSGKFTVCYAGTIGISNALGVLFECARLLQDRPEIHFLVVGEGGLREQYQKQYANLTNVTFTGAVPKDMVQSVLNLCDLAYFSVSKSKVWQYGLSLNKVIDYMIAAKPILASYTGYRSMVDEAGAGVSVPAGDAEALMAEILRLARLPPEELAAMGQRGRDWVLANRDYDKLARDYLAIALPGPAADAA
jgi:glycosyltransferase involved in cell wall biosynthesis